MALDSDSDKAVLVNLAGEIGKLSGRVEGLRSSINDLKDSMSSSIRDIKNQLSDKVANDECRDRQRSYTTAVQRQIGPLVETAVAEMDEKTPLQPIPNLEKKQEQGFLKKIVDNIGTFKALGKALLWIAGLSFIAGGLYVKMNSDVTTIAKKGEQQKMEILREVRDRLKPVVAPLPFPLPVVDKVDTTKKEPKKKAPHAGGRRRKRNQ